MNLTELDFELPEELIATRPVSPRSSARLLVSNGERVAERSVANLLEYLTPKDRLVLNDTKVIPARLSGMRRRSAASGGRGEARIEVTLLHRQENGDWMAARAYGDWTWLGVWRSIRVLCVSEQHCKPDSWLHVASILRHRSV